MRKIEVILATFFYIAIKCLIGIMTILILTIIALPEILLTCWISEEDCS